MYNEKKNSNAFLGFIIALLMIVPAVLGVIFADNIKGWFGKPGDEIPTEEVNPDGELDGDVMTEIQDSDLLKLTKRNKVSANGTALSVTATLSPENVNDKTVTWSIAWKTTNSANVNDYITLTPSADTLTCTVAVKKAFTTQIILTCTSKSNTSVKATCTIDYVGRVDNISVNANNSAYNLDTMTWTDFGNSIESALEDTYNSTGGSLVGTIKNVKVIYDDEFVSDDNGWSCCPDDLDDLIKNCGALNAVIESTHWSIAVTYDVYYGNTLIKSGYIEIIDVVYTWTNKTISATGLTLNDTQLIF